MGGGTGGARPLIPTLRRAVVDGPVIPILVAVGLGLFDIGAKSLWLDEAFAVDLADRPLASLVSYLVRSELHASPYYLALHAWLNLGHGEAAVRSLSVVFGAIAVAATWAVGRRYGVGLGAALILAVAPFFVTFEQEARGYTLLVAWSALATLGYLRLAERPGRFRWATYVGLAGTIIYVHPLAAFVVVAHGVHAAIANPPPGRRLWVAAFALTVVAWIPMLRFAMRRRDAIAWIPAITPEALGAALAQLGGGLIVAGALSVALVIGLTHGRRSLEAVRGLWRDPLVTWAIVPIAGVVMLSVLIQPALQAKYLLMCLPPAAIIAARSPRPVVAVLVGLSLVGVAGWYADGRKEDWRGAVAWIASQAQSGDGLVFAPSYLRSPYRYYGEEPEPAWPAQPWSAGSLLGVPTPVDQASISRHERIWLIRGHGGYAPEGVWDALAGFDPVADRVFRIDDGSAVTLLVRRSAE